MNNLISYKDKIFIAGHKGMVGSAICRALRKNGYLNLCYEERKNLDLTKQADVEKWFSINKPDVVVLAAAKVGGIVANSNYPADFILDNIKIQTNIFDSAKKKRCKKATIFRK